MFPRGDAGAVSVARLALLVVAAVFGCRDFFGALGCVGVDPRVFDFAFFAGFLTDFLAAFFVTGFFAVFLPLLTTRLLSVTPPLVAALMLWLTWRGSFIVLGLVSLVWGLV